ncbi:hypothetical protein N7526_005609 [Penicillium atrosanguineum]|nr:hypothetical protein N7526_005609 [Penicillium atrosanguineum]
MDPTTYKDPELTLQDKMVVEVLLDEIGANDETTSPLQEKMGSKETIKKLHDMNDASSPDFDPTVSQLWETPELRNKLSTAIQQYVLDPYINWAKTVVRVPTDVVMLTHLILYFTTIVPSGFYLYYHFSYLHGILHWAMMGYYCGGFTLMKHQHIHGNGVLASKYWHHHVEGNGEQDLSTTMFYDRDSVRDFACYVGRFIFFVWLELPLYFFRKGQFKYACRVAFWELGNYLAIYILYNYVNARATTFVLILPLTVMRFGLMVGNWGQHAFVDPIDPDSDYRSSITLVDVPSNRYSFNDGYHTSHHLNPRRHWRDHPVAFLVGRDRYAEERALVFRNVDYIFITVNLLRKNYLHLAKCLIPMGDQVNMTMEERVEMLRGRTRRFSHSEMKKQN